MTKTYNKEKLVYASPILIPLGALAKGSGQCTAGSAVIPHEECVNTGTDCTAGATATNDCTAGPTACRDCSSGTAAVRDCTAGTAATAGCTAGSGL
jgi:hypothetical protein